MNIEWPWIAIIALFGVLGLAELVIPARAADQTKGRLRLNFIFGAIALLLQFAVPLGSVAGAALAEELSFGITPWINTPLWLAAILLITARSFAAYWVHRALHHFEFLWRFHSLHHSDRALDLSTSFRNHPGEFALSLPVAALAGFAIGCPPQIVLIAETILFGAALLTHSNLKLPEILDQGLRIVLVTPAVHAVHHERDRARADGNYGDLLIAWDRIFGTWREPSGTAPLGTGQEYSTGLLSELARPFRPWPDSDQPAAKSPEARRNR